MNFRLAASLFLSLLFVPIFAYAHAPYFKPLTDWMPYEGKEYRIEGWFGDGVFFSDPVRVIVRGKDGTVMAITSLGESVSVNCPSLASCGVIISPSGGNGTEFKLAPNEMKSLKIAGGPKDYSGDVIGFFATTIRHP